MIQTNIIVSYHWPAFKLMHELHNDKIGAALHDHPKAIKRKFVLDHLPLGEPLSPHQARPATEKLLAHLEHQIETRLDARTPAYWMHIYRRIAPTLAPQHEGRTDAHITAIVRTYAELAIYKYGNLKRRDKIWEANKLRPNLIFGGWYIKGLKWVKNNEGWDDTAIQSFVSKITGGPTPDIKDFSSKELETIYFVEGIAYQYWMVMTLLRGLSKGAHVIFNQEGNWSYTDDAKVTRLIRSYDLRSDRY